MQLILDIFKRHCHVGRSTNICDDASAISSVVPDVASDLGEGSRPGDLVPSGIVYYGFVDNRRRRAAAAGAESGVGVESDHSWRPNTLHRLTEKVFRSVYISPLAEIEINGSSDFVHCPIQVGPPALHLHVCLVTAPQTPTGRAYWFQRLSNSGT
jgi:hypothetical protein